MSTTTSPGTFRKDRISVRINSGATDVGQHRARLNLIAGANVTLTAADSAANDESQVTIASASPISSADAFVTIGHPADLSASRALTAGLGVTVTDGGANSTVTLAATSLLQITAAGAGETWTLSNSGAETTILTRSIAGGTLGSSGKIRVTVEGIVTDTTASGASAFTLTTRLKYGGTTLATAVLATTATNGTGSQSIGSNAAFLLQGHLDASGATNSQNGVLDLSAPEAFDFLDSGGVNTVMFVVSNSGALARGTAAVDSTASQTLALTLQWSTGATSRTWTIHKITLEIVP